MPYNIGYVKVISALICCRHCNSHYHHSRMLLVTISEIVLSVSNPDDECRPTVFYCTRQHAIAHIYVIVRPSVCLSHGSISQKRLKLGSCNFHHQVAP